MRAFRTTAWVMASVFLVPALVAAQALGDVAAKEKEKKKAAKPAKVYTEDDLKRAGSTGVYSAPEGQAAAADPAQKPADGKAPAGKEGAKSEDDLKAEAQAAWHKDLEKAQAQVAADQKVVDEIQAALGQSTSYYDPSRAKAAGELDQAKAKLAQDQQALSELQDTGRRKGFR